VTIRNFTHDGCLKCEYLGSDSKYDYYTCPQSGIRTFIARYGNEPWEYISAPIDLLWGGWETFDKKSPIAKAYRLYNEVK